MICRLSNLPKHLSRTFRNVVGLVAAAVLPMQAGIAHDIPSSATLEMYVKQEASRVAVLLRVPMETMSEVQFPVRGPGYLDLDLIDSSVAEATLVYFGDSLRFFLDGEDLGTPSIRAARVTMPSDDSFGDFDTALAHVTGPRLTNDIDLFWNQAMLDLFLTYASSSPEALPAGQVPKLSFRASVDRLAAETITVLRYLPGDGVQRAYSFVGDPGLVELDPGWWAAVSRFVVLGFWHILDGADHLLFLFALVIPMRRIGPLVLVVTSFTVAHSITLISSALGLTPTSIWFPSLIETLIAASVFCLACENLLGPRQQARWIAAFGFGLIHGFGFSFVLADRLQFAGNHLLGALLAFNVGVELGQLVVIAVAVPALWLLFRSVLRDAVRERMGIILLSALVAHSAWHWLIERGGRLLQYSWRMPTLDIAFLAAATRWAMLLVGCALVLLAMHEIVMRLRRSQRQFFRPGPRLP